MAKNKITKSQSNSIDPIQPAVEKVQFAFPTKSRCPRCGATDTKATHTDTKNGRQYRQCQRAICKYKYSVIGTKV